MRLTRGDDVESILVPGEPLYVGEVEDIEASVFDGRPTRMTLADTRGNVAALAGLHEAARTGRVVSIPKG